MSPTGQSNRKPVSGHWLGSRAGRNGKLVYRPGWSEQTGQSKRKPSRATDAGRTGQWNGSRSRPLVSQTGRSKRKPSGAGWRSRPAVRNGSPWPLVSQPAGRNGSRLRPLVSQTGQSKRKPSQATRVADRPVETEAVGGHSCRRPASGNGSRLRPLVSQTGQWRKRKPSQATGRRRPASESSR